MTVYHFFIVELPLWGTVLLILGGVPLVAVLAQALMRRLVPPPRAKEHNDVAGFLVAVVGVVYAVTIGFSVDDQWDNYTEVRRCAAEEAFLVAAVARGSAVMDPGDRRDVTEAVVAYNRAVVAWWPKDIGETGQSPDERRTLRRLFTAIGELRPDTEPRQAYVEVATDRLTEVSALNADRHRQAGTAHLRTPMWIAVYLTSAVTLMFSLLFGLESPWLHYTMITGVALVVGVNLFLLVLLEFPLNGVLSVSPGVFTSTTGDLLRDLSASPVPG
ncbi:hypothetical protein GCM10022384_26190 [Streptomyces marokkonensis]|uniref:DUF4239 domain-containing protein n=1 Tax=Streptomyces marokkonensis TaxID=324855 RepID=A0ABP7Q0M4_9ACTN